jgi:hypothetical protein
MKDTLKPFLVKGQQVVKAFLSDTPGEAFTDRIGSWSVRGCFENLNGTRGSYTSETRLQFAIKIANYKPVLLFH